MSRIQDFDLLNLFRHLIAAAVQEGSDRLEVMKIIAHNPSLLIANQCCLNATWPEFRLIDYV